jgi:hypothetical protein
MAGQLDGSLISLDGYTAVIELPFLNIHRVFECWQNTNFVGSITSLGEIDRDGTKYIRLQAAIDPTIWVPHPPTWPPRPPCGLPTRRCRTGMAGGRPTTTHGSELRYERIRSTR